MSKALSPADLTHNKYKTRATATTFHSRSAMIGWVGQDAIHSTNPKEEASGFLLL